MAERSKAADSRFAINDAWVRTPLCVNQILMFSTSNPLKALLSILNGKQQLHFGKVEQT